MKKQLLPLVIVFILFSTNSFSKKKDADIVKNNFNFASQQLQYALGELKNAIAQESDESIHQRAINNWSELTNPRSLETDGSLIVTPSKDWCSGFFPGELWYMYEYTKDNKWRQLAHKQTIIIEREKNNNRTHDMGFKMYCSYGNAYRLTNDTLYANVLLQSAKTLASRFDKTVGCIRSWDFNKETWTFPVIIDNMLNLELLFWATKYTGDSTYHNIAISHASVTMKNHFREDNSSFHVVDYDPTTGNVRKRMTWQGYSDNSAWARGQAWGVYGYTMCFRESGKIEFLEHVKKIANYIFSHPNLPTDLIPYWDYNAPEIPNEPRDVSAATCTASALYELSQYDSTNAKKYLSWANRIVENVSQFYRSPLQQNKGFLLLHSTGSKPGKFEVDAPLVYADYYFLEALLRKQKLESKD